jgi:peptidoglycan/xylan/chitin deacetylase (PgdA/CDA1 family)
LLTIVTYHYVRPLKGSAYPQIKGLELNAFKGQLDYIEQHYQVVSAERVLGAACGEKALPGSPLLLTFDDGYSDHYQYVFPELKRRNMSGVFFPSGGAVADRALLDVNKVQFLLACGTDFHALVGYIESEVDSERKNFDLRSLAEYRKEFWRPNKFDPANIAYIKRMLQTVLPEMLRVRIVKELFQRYVTSDDLAFADDLYLSVQDLKKMAEAGMEIGSHGYKHYWLDSLTQEDQRADIDSSLDFLEKVGVERHRFLFCFPYGAYNQDTLAILEELGCGAAFTLHSAVADLHQCNLLELPRLDTNDLPKSRDALPPRKISHKSI